MPVPGLKIGIAELLEYAAVWNGLYVAAAMLLLAHLLETDVSGVALAGVGMLGMSTYLLDRVKVTRRGFDPADNVAHPRRSAFIRRHARSIRMLLVMSGIVSAVCLWVVHPAAAVLVPLSYAGVMFYARSRRWRWRPKDVFILKNMSVAASIVGLCIVVLILDQLTWNHLVPFVIDETMRLVTAINMMLLHVFADAAACDLDDLEGDAVYRTMTLPVVLNERRTWLIIGLLNLLATLLGIVAWTLQWMPSLMQLLCTLLLPAGTLAVYAACRCSPRVATDLKLPIIATIVLLVGLAI